MTSFQIRPKQNIVVFFRAINRAPQVRSDPYLPSPQSHERRPHLSPLCLPDERRTEQKHMFHPGSSTSISTSTMPKKSTSSLFAVVPTRAVSQQEERTQKTIVGGARLGGGVGEGAAAQTRSLIRRRGPKQYRVSWGRRISLYPNETPKELIKIHPPTNIRKPVLVCSHLPFHAASQS